jgi:hypothetical protein
MTWLLYDENIISQFTSEEMNELLNEFGFNVLNEYGYKEINGKINKIFGKMFVDKVAQLPVYLKIQLNK